MRFEHRVPEPKHEPRALTVGAQIQQRVHGNVRISELINRQTVQKHLLKYYEIRRNTNKNDGCILEGCLK